MKIFLSLVIACFILVSGCVKADKASDGAISKEKKGESASIISNKVDSVSQDIIDAIKKTLNENDSYAGLVHVFKYAVVDQESDLYVVLIADCADKEHIQIGGYDLSAFIVRKNGEVKEYEKSFAGMSFLYQTNEDKKNFSQFPGIILPYGSCYDFNGDGKDEIAVLCTSGIDSYLSIFTYENKGASLSADLISCGEIRYWNVLDFIPHPVQWVTHKGREGFKVYYEAQGAKWPKDKSLPKPWFVGWNEKTKQFEPLEVMSE
jgi:hypothetical protein